MSKRNLPSEKRCATLPRSRPSIHRSRDNHNKSDTPKCPMQSRDDSTIFTTPEFSFKAVEVPNDEGSDSDKLKTSNVETEDDEKNSEISNYTDNEDSTVGSIDEYENEQHRRPVDVNESASVHNIRNRFQDINCKSPKVIHESAFIRNIICDKDKSDARSLSHILNVHQTKIVLYFLVLCALVSIVTSTIYLMSPSKETVDIKLIKTKFITQDDYLWIAFESGVRDVVKLNRPSTFILLYKAEAEGTLTDLLHQLSKYAVCNITDDCSKEPVEISGDELNSFEVMTDYGVLIENYEDTLRDKGVMIIKNLENVPGVSAQVFHSICDEFTPLVDRSLIIFTMRVNELPSTKDRMKFVENYFRNKWTDIKVDTFNALITRITSMVIEIRA